MRLVVATEQRFTAVGDAIYADGTSGYNFWRRYLDGFDEVYVMARIATNLPLPAGSVRADGPGVRFHALPYYVGPLKAAAAMPRLLWRVGRHVRKQDAYILRVPGVIGTLLFFWLTLQRLPYAVEVVGDPHDSLSYVALGSRWSGLVRRPFAALMRLICARATASSYVTRQTLQQRYPNVAGRFSTHYSSLLLSPRIEALLTADSHLFDRAPAQPAAADRAPLKLIFVGSLAQRYKGLHILLAALGACVADGLDMQLTVLGDGRCRSDYEAEARRHGIADRVHFHGMVARETVFEHLQQADLFVMPSLVEGLPRAMIEAMAFGLPCVGSNVGGIPELLDGEQLVPAGDVDALAAKLCDLTADPARRAALGARNRQIATEYRGDVLRARRQQYYVQVRQLTEQAQRDVVRPQPIVSVIDKKAH